MIVKFLGAIDVIAGLMVLFNIFHLPWIITYFFAAILIGKGFTGLFTDAVAAVMGIADIAAALMILFGVEGLVLPKIILFAVLEIKGISSLV